MDDQKGAVMLNEAPVRVLGGAAGRGGVLAQSQDSGIGCGLGGGGPGRLGTSGEQGVEQGPLARPLVLAVGSGAPTASLLTGARAGGHRRRHGQPGLHLRQAVGLLAQVHLHQKQAVLEVSHGLALGASRAELEGVGGRRGTAVQ